jgi:hypothetical protein
MIADGKPLRWEILQHLGFLYNVFNSAVVLKLRYFRIFLNYCIPLFFCLAPIFKSNQLKTMRNDSLPAPFMGNHLYCLAMAKFSYLLTPSH